MGSHNMQREHQEPDELENYEEPVHKHGKIRVVKPILLIILIASCGKNKSSHGDNYFSEIEQKASLYCELSKPEYERNNWVVEECDGAGFTSLYALACGQAGVDLSVFQNPSGEMFRNPNHDCYPARSKAGFSKDHVLMRLVAAVGQGDKEWPKTFLDYTKSNGGFFCDAIDNVTKISRCFISPFLIEYLSKAKGGSSLLEEKYSDDAWGEKEGFEAHLHVLGIWVKGKLDGSISNVDLSYLEAYAKREPMNALYQALAYRYEKASRDSVVSAFDNGYWPSDRMPDSTTHCSDYLFQRDMKSTKDWEPCPEENKVYSGTDYSFAAYILTK